jgi:hypothetical protein
MIEEINYRCCFCNTKIESSSVDPCDVNILINIDKPEEKRDSQTFYCHVNCFKSKMHTTMKGYLVVDIVE